MDALRNGKRAVYRERGALNCHVVCDARNDIANKCLQAARRVVAPYGCQSGVPAAARRVGASEAGLEKVRKGCSELQIGEFLNRDRRTE